MSAIHYPPETKPGPNKMVLTGLIVILIIVGGLIGYYFFFKGDENTGKDAPSSDAPSSDDHEKSDEPPAPAIESFIEENGKDSPGNDIRKSEYTHINDIAQECLETEGCIGFNSNGWLKKAIAPRSTWNSVSATLFHMGDDTFDE